MVFITIGIVMLIKPVYVGVMSKEFAIAWEYVPLLSVSTIISCYASFFSVVYTVGAKTNKVFITTALGAATNLLFNFILVKPLGMQGIAIGTCLGYFAVLLIRARDMKIEMNIGISFKRNIFSFVLLIIHSLILISFGEIQAFLFGIVSLMITSFMYREEMKAIIHLSNPKSYNEKLNWLKINDRKEHYQIMVDKYEAKKYVADKIGEQYVIPTYGAWDRFEDIDFSKLPSNFVLKTTHDSGGVVLINDKNNMDIDRTKDVLEKSLKNNYYYLCREWPYKNLRHRIIAEKMITNTVPNDYKFFMFNGKMDSVMVCTNRASGHPTFRFYDKEWNRLLYQKPELEPESNVERPENYEKMIRIAEQLSENLVHMRVDLYNIDGHIYFGELTFFDQGGFDTDITLETDLKWGELMDLEKIK